MCRLVGWVAPEPLTMREVLGDAAVSRLLELSTVHRDGWGAAWHSPDGVLQTTRSPVAAFEDAAFASLVDSLRVCAATVHLRLGTPGFGRTIAENHPFTDGTWALMHNGAVAPRSIVDALLPPGVSASGTTDSERWFLALRTRLAAGASVDDAAADVIQVAEAAGLHASSWNSLLLGPDALHVINHHDLAWVPVDVQLWPELYPDRAVEWPPYFDLRLRQSRGVTTVLSSGIVDDTTEWTLLPNEAVLSVPLDGTRSAASFVSLPAVPVG
jgi:predicted glutamine amidotransferase